MREEHTSRPGGRGRSGLSAWCVAIAPEGSAEDTGLPLAVLVRPRPLAAVAVLAINDHLLKGSGLLPNVVTGKLSDFSGLLYFPLLLVTALALVKLVVNAALQQQRFLGSPTLADLRAACVLTGLVFAGTEMSQAFADACATGSAAILPSSLAARATSTADLTDLLALPMLLVSYQWGAKTIAQVLPGRLRYVRHRMARGTPDALVHETFRDLLALSAARHAGIEDLVTIIIARPDDASVAQALQTYRERLNSGKTRKSWPTTRLA